MPISRNFCRIRHSLQVRRYAVSHGALFHYAICEYNFRQIVKNFPCYFSSTVSFIVGNFFTILSKFYSQTASFHNDPYSTTALCTFRFIPYPTKISGYRHILPWREVCTNSKIIKVLRN
jgi:hypothetical protein